MDCFPVGKRFWVISRLWKATLQQNTAESREIKAHISFFWGRGVKRNDWCLYVSSAFHLLDALFLLSESATRVENYVQTEASRKHASWAQLGQMRPANRHERSAPQRLLQYTSNEDGWGGRFNSLTSSSSHLRTNLQVVTSQPQALIAKDRKTHSRTVLLCTPAKNRTQLLIKKLRMGRRMSLSPWDDCFDTAIL